MVFSTLFPVLIAQSPPAGGGGTRLGPLQAPGVGVFDPAVSGPFDSLEGIISLLIGFITVLAGLAFVLYFLFAALQWVTAGGDTGKVEKARTQMFNGAVGLIVIIVSYGIIAVIGEVLGLDLLNPGTVIQNTLSPF